MKKLLVATVAVMALGTGCGKGLKSFNVSIPEDNKIDVNFTLDPQYQVNINGDVDIMNYGKLYFVPGNTENGLRLGATVNTASFLKEEWVNYKPTDLLPNGERMPSYVGQKLVHVQVPAAQNKYVYPHVYFGLKDLNTNTGDYYVGLALEVSYINQSFPQGLSVSQTFFNKYNKPIVGITLYGPQLENGELKVPGGFFVAANISNVIDGQHFSENGLKFGFDNGGMSAYSLYKMNERLKKSLAEMPAQTVTTKPMSPAMNSVVDHHDNNIINNLVDSANF